MREIKFRAFSKKDNRMYYGRNVELWNVGDDLSCRVCLDRSVDRHFSEYDVEAIPMQFTGLKDKKGVDIYEGDILKVNSSVQVVEYHRSGFVTMYIQKTDIGFCEWRKDLSQQYKPEVIGNIHQNPDLLS